MTQTREIAIIGLSCRYPGAQNARELWENVLSKRRQFRMIPECRLPLADYYDTKASDKTYATRAAVMDLLKFDWAAHRIPKSSYEGTDLVHWLAYQVAIEAVSDAGYARGSIPRRKTGVILGNTLCGEQTRTLGIRLRWPFISRSLEEGARRAGMSARATRRLLTESEGVLKSVFPMLTEDSLAGAMSNTIAGRIASVFDLDGGGYVVDGACASSLLATMLAADKLVSGDLDLAIVGGVDVSIDPLEMVGYAGAGALTPGDMTVYSQRASGFLLGEGCGMAVLKRLEDARRDGNHIYAVMRGWGMSSDGRGPSPTIEPKSLERAILRAYEGSGLSPTDLDYIEGNGNGIPDDDRAELESVFAALQSDAHKTPRGVGISTVKGLIGHTKGAAGIASLIKAVIALNRRVLPPTAGLSTPHALFEAFAPSLYPLTDGVAHEASAVLRAGVSAVGIGGVSAHVVLESHDTPAEVFAPAIEERAALASSQDTELFLFAGRSKDELAARLAAIEAEAEGLSLGELPDLAHALAREVEDSAPAFRAAIIAHTPEALVDSIRRAHEVLLAAEGDELSYTSLDRRLWVRVSHAAEPIGLVFPGADSCAFKAGRTLVERHGWARAIVADADRAMGAPEKPALSSRMYRETLHARAEAIAAFKSDLAALEVSAPAVCLGSLLFSQMLRRLGVAPSMVAGRDVGLLVALDHASGLGTETVVQLAAERGAAEATGRALSPERTQSLETCLEQAIQTAKVPLIDSDGGAITSASTFLAALERRPRTVKAIEPMLRALDEACALIIEVGPSRDVSLAALEQLGRDGTPCLAIESRPENDRDLNAVVAALFAYGHNLAVSQLFDGRVVRPYVAPRDRNFFRNPCERPFPPASKEQTPPAVLDTPWAERLGVDANVLQEYLEKRGPMLTELIRADLKALAARAELVLPETFIPIPSASDLGKRPGAERTEGGAELGESADVMIGGEDIEGSIIKLIIEKTGYPESSISLESRLLDDLNLDSIKAAEVVGTTAQTFGADGKIDASMFANASIHEIAGAVRMARMNEAVDIGAMEGGPKILKPSEIGDPPWVRNFASGILEAAPLEPDVAGSFREEEDWTSAVVLILADQEDSNPLAKALLKQLGELGAVVSIWPYSAEGALERGRFSHTFAILPDKTAADRLDSRLPLQRMVKRLHCAATVSSGPNRFPRQRVNALTFVQFGGGTFAGEPSTEAFEDVGVVSFAASVHLERLRQRVKVIDVSSKLAPEQIAERVVREVEAPGNWSAAGYDENLTRRELRCRLHDRSKYEERKIDWSGSDVVLATGGARGITAECALSFARATGGKLALLGNTVHKPGDPGEVHAEIDRTLARAEADGLTARYYACDVTSESALREVIEQVERELGGVTGVIHGAGLNHAKVVEQSSEEEGFLQLRPKVIGTINLMRVLEGRPLKLFSALTSIIGVAGIQGNSWYALANEMTDLLLRGFHARTGVAVLASAYGIWSEVGMGARMGAVAAVEKIGTAAIPPVEGANRFVELMLKDPGCRQVVITARLAGLDTWRTDALSIEPRASRFLERIMRAEAGVDVVARTQLDQERDPYLVDHTWAGSPLFPAVFGVEAMAQAVALVTGRRDFDGTTLTIEDLRFQRPIIVHPEYGAELQVSALVAEHAPGEPVRVTTRITTKQLAFKTDCFSAVFVLEPGPLSDVVAPKEEPATDAHVRPEDFYGSHLFHGPAFQRIKSVAEVSPVRVRFKSELDGDKAALAAGGTPLLTLDPFFLDTLLHGMALGRLESVALPTRIGKIRFDFSHGLRTTMAPVVATIEDVSEDEYRGDAVACDEAGRVYVALEGVTLKAVEHRAEASAALVTELLSPAQRDAASVRLALGSSARKLGVEVPPAIDIAHTPGIHDLPREERRVRALPLLERVAGAWRSTTGGVGATIAWQPSGKPFIEGDTVGDISLSHDDHLCLAVAGPAPQGCDVVLVEGRRLGDWITMLGNRRRLLLEALEAKEPASIAGARVWAALEAVRKTGRVGHEMRLVGEAEEAVLLEVSDKGEGPMLVLTTCLQLAGDRMRVIAVVVSRPSGLSAAPKGDGAKDALETAARVARHA